MVVNSHIMEYYIGFLSECDLIFLYTLPLHLEITFCCTSRCKQSFLNDKISLKVRGAQWSSL